MRKKTQDVPARASPVVEISGDLNKRFQCGIYPT